MGSRGFISDDGEDLSGIHPVNINSKKGVTINKNGHFVIPVTLNDYFNFFQYNSKKASNY